MVRLTVLVALLGTATLFWVACDPPRDSSDAGTMLDAEEPDAEGDPPDDAASESDAGGEADGSASDAGPGAADDAGASTDDARVAVEDAGALTGFAGCPSPLPSSWIFCDDFEGAEPDLTRYFEYNSAGGAFVRSASASASGRYAMEARFGAGATNVGDLKVTFGDAPIGADHRSGERFDEIFWRMRVRHQPGWTGSPNKLSRATMFVDGGWSQAMIAHLWSSPGFLVLDGDPATCVTAGTPTCSGYNDFSELRWLGIMRGTTPIFDAAGAGRWRCVEGHVRLNTPGSLDGVFEVWIDDAMDSRRTDLDWRGTYAGHGVNAVFFENYWNAGSPVEQTRWFDDLAIATERIGCD